MFLVHKKRGIEFQQFTHDHGSCTPQRDRVDIPKRDSKRDLIEVPGLPLFKLFISQLIQRQSDDLLYFIRFPFHRRPFFQETDEWLNLMICSFQIKWCDGARDADKVGVDTNLFMCFPECCTLQRFISLFSPAGKADLPCMTYTFRAQRQNDIHILLIRSRVEGDQNCTWIATFIGEQRTNYLLALGPGEQFYLSRFSGKLIIR